MFAGTLISVELKMVTAENLSPLHNLPKSQDEFQRRAGWGRRGGGGGAEAVMYKTATEKPALD